MARKRKAKKKAKPRTGKRGRPPNGTVDWKPTFLENILAGLHVTNAAKIAKVNLAQPYKARRDDPVFASAWDEAARIGTRALESEANRRAFHGVLEPIMYKGKRVGYIQKYSDTLLMFLLRARRPHKYRDNLNVSGTIRGRFAIDDDIPDAEIPARLADLQARLDDIEMAEAEAASTNGALPVCSRNGSH